jgi:ubiquinone/menaquinone biosynthesis C-methylase UbiE
MRVAYRRLVWLSVVLLLIGTALPLGAEEQNVRPGVNRQYENPEFSVWLNRFEVPGREVFDMRHEIVAQLGLQPGMQVADVGAGTGFFTLLFADKVGDSGAVYAVDISEIFIRNILRRSKKKGLTNIRGIVGSDRDAGLPEGQFDLIFVCDTYHHFEYPQSMLASLRRSLRSNGKLVLIDYRKVEGLSREWIMNHVRANKETVIKEVKQAGFALKSDSDLLTENFFLTFESPKKSQK